MNFLLIRGQDFTEHFDFKNAQGKPVAMPSGTFKIILERGGFVRQYTYGNGLDRLANRITWRIPASESQEFTFSNMYYTLYLDDQELTRGVLKIQ